MTEPDKDQQIIELISSKIAAEDADSGWVLAYATMRVLPVLKEIAAGLEAINGAIAPDNKASPSVASRLGHIGDQLRELVKFVQGERQ
jgi:hypothetical protein